MSPLCGKITARRRRLFSLICAYTVPFVSWRSQVRAKKRNPMIHSAAPKNRNVALPMGFSMRPSNWLWSNSGRLEESRKMSSGYISPECVRFLRENNFWIIRPIICRFYHTDLSRMRRRGRRYAPAKKNAANRSVKMIGRSNNAGTGAP